MKKISIIAFISLLFANQRISAMSKLKGPVLPEIAAKNFALLIFESKQNGMSKEEIQQGFDLIKENFLEEFETESEQHSFKTMLNLLLKEKRPSWADLDALARNESQRLYDFMEQHSFDPKQCETILADTMHEASDNLTPQECDFYATALEAYAYQLDASTTNK